MKITVTKEHVEKYFETYEDRQLGANECCPIFWALKASGLEVKAVNYDDIECADGTEIYTSPEMRRFISQNDTWMEGNMEPDIEEYPIPLPVTFHIRMSEE